MMMMMILKIPTSVCFGLEQDFVFNLRSLSGLSCLRIRLAPRSSY